MLLLFFIGEMSKFVRGSITMPILPILDVFVTGGVIFIDFGGLFDG